MLLFSTTLDINDTMTPDDFIALVIECIKDNYYEENVIKDINWNGEHSARYGDENLWLAFEEYRRENIIAARYEKRALDGVVWDTDYVMNFNTMKLTIHLQRGFLQGAAKIDPSFSTPYFIALLIKNGYLKHDGPLPIESVPTTVDTENIGMLCEIISGALRLRLPVVYVSKTYDDAEPFNVKRLAYRLKGVAHVLSEESKALNPDIAACCQSRNPSNGSVIVCYPHPGVENQYYNYRPETGRGEEMFSAIVRAVIEYSNAQMTGPLSTWQGVRGELLEAQLKSQREKREAAETHNVQLKREESELLDAMEEDWRRLQEQNAALQSANEKLSAENHGLRGKLSVQSAQPLVYQGEEAEFYPGEIKDFILAAVEEALKNSAQDTRKADVLADIIEHNDYEQTGKKRAEKINDLLKSYTRMTPPVKQALTDLGFEITGDGKHYKLTYHGDDRYQVTIAKTPSDRRAGRNIVGTITKKIY